MNDADRQILKIFENSNNMGLLFLKPVKTDMACAESSFYDSDSAPRCQYRLIPYFALFHLLFARILVTHISLIGSQRIGE